jgi:hypothetical protein
MSCLGREFDAAKERLLQATLQEAEKPWCPAAQAELWRARWQYTFLLQPMEREAGQQVLPLEES